MMHEVSLAQVKQFYGHFLHIFYTTTMVGGHEMQTSCELLLSKVHVRQKGMTVKQATQLPFTR